MKTPNVADIYELAPIQQGLLFHALYSPHSSAYFDRNCLTIAGAFDCPGFKAAWQQVIDRHPALRTSFHWEKLNKPVQVVHRQVELPWTEYDWRDRSPDRQQADLADLLAQDRAAGFDFSRPPLLRLTVIRLAEDKYHLVFTKHHILLDGWSRLAVFKEVFALYRSQVCGESYTLPTPVPYRLYINWLRQQERDRAEGFWREMLQGFTSPTQTAIAALGTEASDSPHLQQRLWLDEKRVRPARTQVPGQTGTKSTTDALQTLTRQHHLTLNTLVLAAWSWLLHRYSGETDIVFGATSSGRSAEIPQVEAIVGAFVNTLPLRVEIPLQGLLLDWLRGLQARQLEMRQYEYTSLVQIQRLSDLPQATPLFETIVVFENYPVDTSLREPDDTLEVVAAHSEAQNHYPLSLYATGGKTPYLELHYDRRRFDEATIGQMLDYLHLLLDRMAANPQQSLAQLPSLTPGEARQIASWNQTQADYPRQRCVHQEVEAQVALTPEAIALEHGDTTLTYRELNDRANRLAETLRQLGVSPEVRVGLCLERSPQMVVALLAVLKAGGAYIPLDPAYPQQRLAYMVADAGIGLLLSESHLLELFPNYLGCTLCLDCSLPSPEITKPPVVLDPDNLAYIIYTSGSTGRPKGVQISHRAVVNFLNAHRQQPGLDATDVLLAVTSLSFDIALLELLLPLTVGARVVLADRPVAADGFRLAQLLDSARVTAMQATPATWRLLLAANWQPQSRLKILCGGETLSEVLAERLHPYAKSLWNLYGPTEATIWATQQEIVPGESITIGSAIANLHVYLLDPRGQPVPIGVPGELHIGGEGLARGYLHRPGLTAERFVPNPFSRHGGARLYRTGDLARFRRDGQLEFLGRLDTQVKVRGFRLELGEVESHLGHHPQLQEAVVTAWPDDSQQQQLAAYVVPNVPGSPPEVGELRQFLKSRLPEFAIPSRFVFLEALPLTPNGKVDRRSLPDPRQAPSGTEVSPAAPQTLVERQLAEIWQGLLNADAIGLTDDFFEIGGHSLLAIQLLARVRESFAVDLPLRHLFEKSTLTEQASWIADLKAGRVTLEDSTEEADVTEPRINSTHGHQVIDFEQEARLDPTIRPRRSRLSVAGAASAIFLTGATGFLGAFLLAQLLQQTEAIVYCLVRGSDRQVARSKIEANLAAYQLWQAGFADRIVPVLGDLSRPLLGLDLESFQRLAKRVDTIYHNGALVNFVYPYAKLKAVNVLGTQEILRLACLETAKPVHFISTFGVFSEADVGETGKICESDNPLGGSRLKSGYSQSKWVAEKLVCTGRDRGLPVVIYRPGRITGDSETGCSNPQDMFLRFVKGCFQLGCIPDPESDKLVDLTPVDYVSRAIVWISQQESAFGKAFHLVNPRPISVQEFVKWLVERSENSIEVLPYDCWREKLVQSPQNALYPLLLRFPKSVEPVRKGDRKPSLESRFDCRATLAILEGTTIGCSPADWNLLDTYLSFFLRSGFLSASEPARLS